MHAMKLYPKFNFYYVFCHLLELEISLTRLCDLVEAMPMTPVLPEAILTQIKHLAFPTSDPGPCDRVHLTSVTSHPWMSAGNQFHLSDEAGPVGLLGKVYCDILAIGADSCG